MEMGGRLDTLVLPQVDRETTCACGCYGIYPVSDKLPVCNRRFTVRVWHPG